MGTKAPILLALALFASTLVSCLPDTPGGQAVLLSPQEAWEFIQNHEGDPDFVILDVRTPGEYAAGHIAGAVLIDYRSPTFEEELGGLSRDATYLVYCRSGNRSADAVEVMARRGFTRIYELAGGIQAWERAGLPVEE